MKHTYKDLHTYKPNNIKYDTLISLRYLSNELKHNFYTLFYS